jgi:hypothetical protein
MNDYEIYSFTAFKGWIKDDLRLVEGTTNKDLDKELVIDFREKVASSLQSLWMILGEKSKLNIQS